MTAPKPVSGHTAGPLEAREDVHSGGCWKVVLAETPNVCTAIYLTEADAHLYAAAPDLVAAAREGLICAEADIEAERNLNAEHGDNDEDDPFMKVFIARRDLIAAAIAKATGEAQ